MPDGPLALEPSKTWHCVCRHKRVCRHNLFATTTIKDIDDAEDVPDRCGGCRADGLADDTAGIRPAAACRAAESQRGDRLQGAAHRGLQADRRAREAAPGARAASRVPGAATA